MNVKPTAAILFLGLPMALLTFGCASSGNSKSDVTKTAVYQPGVPGGTMIESYRVFATVTGVDVGSRQVSLVAEDGSRRTVLAGPEYAAFDQLKPGDKVKVAVTKEVIISLNQSATTANGDIGTMAETVLVAAKVTAIDVAGRKVTLHFPSGSTETFPVRPDVDLTQQRVGETVFIRATQSAKLLAEMP
jgi:Cu/Ag efflux protein CusF